MDQDRAADFVRRFSEFWQAPAVEHLDTVLAPDEQRIKNGITATVIDAGRHEDKVTIKTNEHEPREIEIDTGKFSDLSLNYAMHVNKGQGITAETSGILIGGWQTDKEHAYVTVSRAREQTQIYVSREDLGEQGLDTGALERLAERIQRSRAQQATIAKQTAAERDEQAQPELHSRRAPIRRRHGHAVTDEDGIVRDLRDHDTERAQNATPEPVPQTTRRNRARLGRRSPEHPG